MQVIHLLSSSAGIDRRRHALAKQGAPRIRECPETPRGEWTRKHGCRMNGSAMAYNPSIRRKRSYPISHQMTGGELLCRFNKISLY